MPVTVRFFRTSCLTVLVCLAGVTTAVAGGGDKPVASDRAAPSTLALPARHVVWPSMPRLTLWWQGAQPAASSQPAQPAAPTTPAPSEPAPADQPAESAPAAPSAAPAASSPAPGPSDADIVAQAEAELAAGGGEQEGEVIVVTGSAIERKETTTPAPVSVVDREELNAAGTVSVGDILQNLPAQSNGINVQFNNGGDGTTRVDLRGLGAERTLVLVNGRRHVQGGTDPNSAVDLNAIPLAVIKRVEVLKDGASAVYGSDALGGVVNIITRDDFQGTEANVYTGTTQHGDGTVVDVSVVTGQASKRGNVLFSAGYSDQRPVFAGDRGFAEVSLGHNYAQDTTQTDGSFVLPEGNVFISDGDIMAHPELAETASPLCQTQRTNGCIPDPNSPSGFRDVDASGVTEAGGDLYNFQPENYLVAPLRRYNVFSTGNYRFHDNVRGFFEASYNDRKSTQRLAPEPLSTSTEGIAVSKDSIYNKSGYDLFDVNRRMVEAGPRKFSQTVDTFRVVAGLDGTLPKELVEGWKWEASFNYGRTQGTITNDGRLVLNRVQKALGPSFRDDSGQAFCGTGPDDAIEGCVPLDLLHGPGSITPEMLDYITYSGIEESFVQQRTWLGTLNGPLFKTPWNGDVVLALGGDFRQEDGADQPDPLTAAGDTTGNKAEPTGGGYDVVEGFGELSIVPVTGEAWAKWLEINLAAREVNYSTFGDHFTWKAGGLWRFAGGIAARGTYSTAFRAPTIGELFSGEGDSFENGGDPCNTSNGPLAEPVRGNCAADIMRQTNNAVDPNGFVDERSQIASRVGGDPTLKPETAKVYTGGLVYEPEFAEGLGMSVDYFNITIDSALQQATTSVILSNCYAASNAADCALIRRNPANGRIESVRDLERNIGGLATAGIDFNVNYEHSYPQLGRFRHNLEGTWLNKYEAVFPSRKVDALGVYDLEGVFPRWKVNFTTLWGLKGVGLGVNARYIHSIRECASNNCQEGTATSMLDHKVDANVTGDAFATYTLKSPVGGSTLTVGVNNVTDKDPPLMYNGFLANSDASAYDYLGRFFYARLTQTF